MLLALMMCVTILAGCVTPWERKSLLEDKNANIDNVRGPTERRLRDYLWQKKQEEIAESDGTLKPIAGTEEYVAAESFYDDKQYVEAQAAFKKVAKKFKKSEIREDALFMQGEAAFQQGNFYAAENAYAMLLRDFPSTRHLDNVSQRLFEISRQWLDFPKVAEVGEIQQANFDDFSQRLPADSPVEKGRTPVWVPNFTDKSKPWFDTEGNGIACLRLIWLNDPTGPLADDALMLAASHYSRRNNFVEADRHFTLLREEYPNSPHVQNAFVLGSHVKLMSYQGAAYDGKTLQDAEGLKKTILRLYPEAKDRGRVEDELARIEEAKADREWELVTFYERKGNKRAQAVHCHLVIDRFPHSQAAQRARKRLQDLGPEYANGQRLLTSRPDPDRAWYDLRNPRDATPPALPPQPPAKAKVEEPKAEKPATPPRRLFGIFGGNSENEDAPTDSEAKPIEDSEDPPRRNWFGRPVPQESPVDEEPRETLINGEDEEPRSRNPFRFSRPRRLDDATTEKDAPSEPGMSGSSRL
jgi:outer membrane protein assembly factor BamD (BamD/ComL family)